MSKGLSECLVGWRASKSALVVSRALRVVGLILFACSLVMPISLTKHPSPDDVLNFAGAKYFLFAFGLWLFGIVEAIQTLDLKIGVVALLTFVSWLSNFTIFSQMSFRHSFFAALSPWVFAIAWFFLRGDRPPMTGGDENHAGWPLAPYYLWATSVSVIHLSSMIVERHSVQRLTSHSTPDVAHSATPVN